MFFSLDQKNIQRQRNETFCFHYLYAIPLLSYGLCSCWHEEDEKKNTSCAREPGELLKGIGGGKQREDVLTSGLIWDRMGTNTWGMKKPLLSLRSLFAALKALQLPPGTLEKKKQKPEYSLCWWTCEEGTPSKVQFREHALVPWAYWGARHLLGLSSALPGVLSISWDEALCSCQFCISILITEYKLFLANVTYAYSFTDSSLLRKFFYYQKNWFDLQIIIKCAKQQWWLQQNWKEIIKENPPAISLYLSVTYLLWRIVHMDLSEGINRNNFSMEKIAIWHFKSDLKKVKL